MGWKDQIFRCFFVAFGIAEIITNGNYLRLKDVMKLAIKQHGELPKGISDKKVKVKVCCMFISGIVFFIAGLSAFIMKEVKSSIFISVLSAFSLYALCEAFYYKYWKTAGFAMLSLLVTFLFII